MNEITKPNDILVSTMLNGEMDTMQLVSNGLNATNTQLLTPEDYKESPFIQKQFSDDKGVFNEDAFNNAYLKAAQSYQDLITTKSYNDLENFVEYNLNDIYAPLDAKKATPKMEMQKELNPMGLSEGVFSLFGKGNATKSMRELAQQSKIWDTENQKWLDETADERGVLKSLFGQSLVYATWDEDGVHEDPFTGRQIKHKKGDWKLNEDGQYYTETIGNRQSYDKQFVAATDTLTKEGSALNKIDFFDSDGLEKSVAGTTFKALANIGMYMIPGVNVAWGATTAAINLAKVMPAFAKMLEGIAVGGDANSETSFTKAMNKWENYFKKLDPSYSDADQKSNWSYAKIADTVSDVFGQLYQMRAAASLSKLVMKDPQQKAINKFNKEFLPKYIKANAKANSGLEFSAQEFKDIYNMAASKMPEVKKLLEKQSKLSQRLSLGYMALTSSADVYQDAIQGGYDRRMAGLAGLIATAGQYGIMMNNRMGDWFLDKTTGYTKEANRALIKKAIKPHYDEIANGIKTMEQEATKEGKVKAIGNIFNKVGKGFKKLFTDVRDGTEPFWKNAIVEGVEEMTEEAVMDTTKGIFDFLTWAGLGSNRNASFGGWERVFSSEGLERYALNAFGGFLGGALFELQGKKIEPWITAKVTGQSTPELQPSLIRLIADGQSGEIKKTLADLAKSDNEVSYLPANVKGTEIEYSAGVNQETRGQRAAKIVSDYVDMLEGLMIEENTHLSDEQILQKTVRDYQAMKMLENSGISNLVISDFTKIASDIANIRTELKSRSEDQTDKKDTAKTEAEDKKEKKEQEKKTEEPKTEEEKEVAEVETKNPSLDGEEKDYSTMSVPELKVELENKRKQLQGFLDGSNGLDYLKKSLAYFIPEIRNALGNVSLERFAEIKYDVNIQDPAIKETDKKRIQDEYEEWKKESDIEKKYLKFGSEAFDKFVKLWSPAAVEYNESYQEVGRKILDQALAARTFNIGDVLTDDVKAWNILQDIVTQLKINKQGGLKVQDIFKQDPKKLKQSVSDIISNDSASEKVLLKSGYTKDDIINIVTKDLLDILESANFGDFSGDALQLQVAQSLRGVLAKSFENLQTEIGHPLTYADILNYLTSVGMDTTGLDLSVDESNVAPEDLKRSLLEMFTSVAAPNVEGVKFGINSSILYDFLDQQDVVDSDLVKEIQEEAVKEIITYVNNLDSVPFNVDISATNSVSVIFTTSDLKKLTEQIELNYGEIPLKDIILKWYESNQNLFQITSDTDEEGGDFFGFNPSESLSDSEQNKIKSSIVEDIYKQLKTAPTSQLYERIKNKKTLTNPIFKALRDMDLHLNGGSSVRALEILEQQSKNLYSAEKLSDFLMPQEIIDQIQNILNELDLITAVVYSTQDADPELGDPFQYNKQIIRYLEKYKKGEGKDKYPLLPKNVVEQINLEELERIRQRCKLLLAVQNNNFVSKLEMDRKTAENISKLYLDTILTQGARLTIKGVSVLPTEQELQSQETYEGKLELIESKLREAFVSVKQEERLGVLKELVAGLNIDLKSIITNRVQPSNLSENLNILNERDKLNWLASALGRNVKDFLWTKRAIDQNSENDKVPLFIQKIVAKQQWSAATDTVTVTMGDGSVQSAHDALIDLLFEDTPEDITVLKVKGISMVNGITGAGKSSVTGGVVISGSPNKIIYVSAPNQNQVDHYVAAISKYSKQPDLILSGTKDKFFEQFFDATTLARLKEDSHKKFEAGQKETEFYTQIEIDKYQIAKLNVNKVPFKDNIDKNKLPQIVLFDEATHLTSGEILLMGKIHEKFGINFILSGDTAQIGTVEKGDKDSVSNLFIWESPKMNVSIRAANNQKQKNNQRLHGAANKYKQSLNINPKYADKELSDYLEEESTRLDISYYEDENVLAGDKIVSDISKYTEDLQKILKLARAAKQNAKGDSWKVGVITDLDDEGNPVSGNNILQILKDTGYSSEDYVLYSPEAIHKNAVQGDERDYFIIHSLPFQNSLGQDVQLAYTHFSRSLKASLIQMSDADRSRLKMRNIKDKITHDDSSPIIQRKQELLDKEIDYINKFLGEYTKKDPGEIKTIDVDGKKVPVRTLPKDTKSDSKDSKNSKDSKDSKEKKSSEKSAKTSDTKDEVTPLKEQDVDAIADAIQHAGDEVSSKESKEPDMNRRDTAQIKRDDTVDGMTVWTFLDHMGLEEYVENGKPQNSFVADDPKTSNHFGLSGLLEPDATRKMFLNNQDFKGYQRFIHVLQALDPNESTHEQIVKAIASDPNIAAFFRTLNPQIVVNAFKQGDITDVKKQTPEVYADWADTYGLDIDPTIYIIAKKYNSKTDGSHTVADYDNSKAPEEGEIVLHIGVRLFNNNLQGQSGINQWISLGRLSRKTLPDGSLYKSEGFNAIYSAAESSLANANNKKLAVFKLPNQKVQDLKADSTFWVKQHSDPTHFENLSAQERRGATIDKEHIILLDNSKVNVEGFAEPQYKALVLMAQYDAVCEEVYGDKLYARKTFEEKLKYLNQAFVRVSPEGDEYCTLSGKYLTFVNFGYEGQNDKKGFRRAIVQSPATFSAKSVLSQLRFVKESDTKTDFTFTSKGMKSNPESQAKIICALITQATEGDFGHVVDALRLIWFKMGSEARKGRDARLLEQLIKSLENGEITDMATLQNKLRFGLTRNGVFYKGIKRMLYYTKLALVQGTGGEKTPFTVYKLDFKVDEKPEDIKQKGWKKIEINFDQVPDSVANPMFTAQDPTLDLTEEFPDIFTPEFKAKVSKIDGTVLDPFTCYRIDMSATGASSIMGLKGYFLEVPRLRIPEAGFANWSQLSDLEIDLQQADFGNKWEEGKYIDKVVFEKPEGFDGSLYLVPKTIKSEMAYEVLKDKDEIAALKNLRKGHSKKELKTVYKDGKPVYEKGKKGQRAHPKKVEVETLDFKKPVWYIYEGFNDWGWKFKLYDSVQIWGRPDVYRIDYVDHNKQTVWLSVSGKRVAKVPYNAITKVVKRSIVDKKEKYWDAYQQGSVGATKADLPDFQNLEKSVDLFLETAEDGPSREKIFEFNEAGKTTYIFMPLYDNDSAYSKLTEDNFEDPNVIWIDNFGEVSEKLDLMKSYLSQDRKDADDNIIQKPIGYRIIRVYKTPEVTDSGGIAWDISKIVNKVNDNLYYHQTDPKTALWIRHIIYTDYQNVKNEQYTFKPTTTYDLNELQKDLLKNPENWKFTFSSGNAQKDRRDWEQAGAQHEQYFPDKRFTRKSGGEPYVLYPLIGLLSSEERIKTSVTFNTNQKNITVSTPVIDREYFDKVVSLGKQKIQELQIISATHLKMYKKGNNADVNPDDDSKFAIYVIDGYQESAQSSGSLSIPIIFLHAEGPGSKKFAIPAYQLAIESWRFKIPTAQEMQTYQEPTATSSTNSSQPVITAQPTIQPVSNLMNISNDGIVDGLDDDVDDNMDTSNSVPDSSNFTTNSTTSNSQDSSDQFLQKIISQASQDIQQELNNNLQGLITIVSEDGAGGILVNSALLEVSNLSKDAKQFLRKLC